MTKLDFYVRPVMSADFKLISENLPLLKGVVFYSRLVESYQKASFGILAASKLPYLIDPETPIFCLPPTRFWKENEPTPKDSFKVVSGKFGEPISSAVSQNRSLNADDFYSGGKLDSQLINAFVKRVINYQRTCFNQLSNSSLVAFFMGEEEKKSHLKGIIPPYFLLESVSDKWYEVYKAIIQEAIADKGKDRLYVVLPIQETLLTPSNRAQLIQDFVDNKAVDGVILWVNALKETGAVGVARLADYLSFIRELGKRGKELVIFYGGFLTATMAHFGVNVTCSGMQFWDYRDVYQAPGGRISKRYYLDFLHDYRSFEEAMRILGNYREGTCSCEYCQTKIYTSPNPPLSAFKGHFLFVRSNEIASINSYNGFEDLRDVLLKEFDHVIESDVIDRADKDHLKTWKDVLAGL
jgi:hypothetical protein